MQLDADIANSVLRDGEDEYDEDIRLRSNF